MAAKKKAKTTKSKKTSIKKIEQSLARTFERMSPTAGDEASLAFHYAGLVSWEPCEIEKVAKGKEVLWISNQLYEKKDDGTYVYEDFSLGPCKKVIHLDGGKRATEYLKGNE